MANLKQVSVSVAFRSVLERCHDFLVSHTRTHATNRGRGRGRPPSPTYIHAYALCLMPFALIVCIYFCFINKIVSFEPSLLLIKRHWAVSLFPMARGAGRGSLSHGCSTLSGCLFRLRLRQRKLPTAAGVAEMLHFDCRRGVSLRMVRLNYKKCCCLHMIVTNI